MLNAKAGAIVVGARPPLIAFNIELDTADVKIAKKIAKEIRESSGGLPAVQALGFELTDPPRAQVSMNLLDTSQTSLATVWREVERRATEAGVSILRGELIGLLPLDAALQVTADALKLEKFERSRVIEIALPGVNTGARGVSSLETGPLLLPALVAEIPRSRLSLTTLPALPSSN